MIPIYSSTGITNLDDHLKVSHWNHLIFSLFFFGFLSFNPCALPRFKRVIILLLILFLSFPFKISMSAGHCQLVCEIQLPALFQYMDPKLVHYFLQM